MIQTDRLLWKRIKLIGPWFTDAHVTPTTKQLSEGAHDRLVKCHLQSDLFGLGAKLQLI